MEDESNLAEPIGQEQIEFSGVDGHQHVLTLVLGKPYLTQKNALQVWRCPFAYGVDGALVSGSCGGPGIVAAVINAALTLEAHRSKLIDEPELARRRGEDTDTDLS